MRPAPTCFLQVILSALRQCGTHQITDCYRLESGAGAEALGLTDYFYGGGVCLIEWAQNIADVLPENCRRVAIVKVSEEERRIEY